MEKSSYAKLVVCLEIILVAIGHPIMAALFLSLIQSNESLHIQIFVSFILPIPAATLSMAYLLVLGIRQRNSEHLQSWFVLQCILLCWMIVTTATYMISAVGPSSFLIGTLVFYIMYKPFVVFLVHLFNIEVRKEDTSPEICDASRAKAVFYMEIFIIMSYTASIVYKFVVEDFMTASILLLFMCIYAGCMVLFAEMLHIGIFEKHRGKLKWWIFLSYMGCLVQLVVGGLNFYTNFNDLLWINHFLFFLYKAWSVYVITVFRCTLEREDILDLPMAMADDRPGNNSQRQDWLYASVPMAAAAANYCSFGQTQATTASYL